MNAPVKILSRLTLSILLLFVLGCNLPLAHQPPMTPPMQSQVGTIAALTLQAVQMPPLGTPTLPPTPTSSPTPTITPTYSPPRLQINAASDCRKGPGQEYDIVTTLQAGERVDITGKHPTEDYWVVKNPRGSGTCWVRGEHATLSGSHWTVPTVSPPPTRTPSPPARPSLKHYEFVCTWNGVNNDMRMTITWTDRADNEAGYRIYRNGVVIADLAPNTTTYVDVFAVNSGVPVTYGIEAYNVAGGSGQATFSDACP
ncbi:MAG: SH3 domain-containing protein [Anaerolineae bacterium]|nr:MAG: SH3 domain-containing protein [Anaerolineae bacterium]